MILIILGLLFAILYLITLATKYYVCLLIIKHDISDKKAKAITKMMSINIGIKLPELP